MGPPAAPRSRAQRLIRNFPRCDAARGVLPLQDMWDILTWHNGTLSIAWWAFLVLAFLLLVAGGSRAAKR